MPASQPGRSVAPDVPEVALNRLRFLTMDEAAPSRVRPTILASWERSRSLNVAADKIEMPYVADPETDSPLTRSAEPVLARLHDELVGHAVSIVLTDADGLVLSRRTDDAELDRHLDRVLLAPGFNYAERFVGTNGIGTALEAGSATQVFGHEHYAEHLEDLACAGVPIHDPTSGRLLGVIDLTCWRKDAHSLLLTLAKTTADQIHQALQANASIREFEVLQAYRQTCRRTSGIVFALTSNATLLNDHARTELDPSDQAALLARATEVDAGLAGGQRRTLDVRLPTGAPARLYCHQVAIGTEPAGLVVHVKLAEPDLVPAERRSVGTRMLLPGLVGDAPLWRRACQQVEAAFAQQTWVALEGEPGVGKLALLRSVQLRHQPARRSTVLDAMDARTNREWMTTVRDRLADTDTVVITHVDSLDKFGLRGLSSALQTAKLTRESGPLWVAVTMGTGQDHAALGQLMSFFPTTVGVPPLRLRLEDLNALVPFFLAKLAHRGHVTCSSEAMRLLMRSSWTGNVEQLQQVLAQVVQHRRSGSITARDLPPQLHTRSRRVLTPLESMERDAIVRSLADADGNKVQAARGLGMSRATIYRKIHEYGIVNPS